MASSIPVRGSAAQLKEAAASPSGSATRSAASTACCRCLRLT